MFKIVYPICCGMDVHKSFLVACIASTSGQGVTSYISKRFSTFTGELRRCAACLAENNCRDVCMESTGGYWILFTTFWSLLQYLGLVTAISGMVFVIVYFILYFQFLMRGLEILILRVGIPLACVGLLDNDKGVFKAYLNKFFQSTRGR